MKNQVITKRKLSALDIELHKTLPFTFDEDKLTLSSFIWERLQQLVLHKYARHVIQEVERRKTIWTGSRTQVFVYVITRHVFEPTSHGRPNTPAKPTTTRTRKYNFPRSPLEA
jgi:hypothetical protein